MDSFLEAHISTKNFAAVLAPLNEPSLIAAFRRNTTAASASGVVHVEYPLQQNLTDGAGHGVLVATDNVYLQIGSLTTGVQNTMTCWMLYRFKKVNVLEYIGIVQSQQ